MDVVTLSAAKADSRRRYDVVSPKLAAWHRQMRRAETDASVLIASDSTGNEIDEWPYLFTLMLAAAYLGWTIDYRLFDDATKTYGAATRIQTGTNGRTLTIYNASVPGVTISYAMNTAAVYAGLTPSLIIFNYGHNSPQVGDDYRAVAAQVFNGFEGRYPKAVIVNTAQNPRAADDATYTDGQGRQRANAELAYDRGYPLIDVNSAMLADPDYAAKYIAADKLHPNVAGRAFWAEVAWDVLKPRALTVPQQTGGPSRLYVPASDMYAISGSPTYGIVGDVPAWTLPDAATSAVGMVFDIPNGWARQYVHLVIQGAAGVYSLQAAHKYLGTIGNVSPSNPATTTWTENSGALANHTLAASGILVALAYNRIGFSSSPVAVKFTRLGAADAATTPLSIIGAYVERGF